MRKVLISIFTLIFIISMITVVNAASGSVTLTASQTQVAVGGTFTVTLEATADENITGLESTLTFDNNVLSLESKSVGSGFSDLSGSDSEIAITSTNSNSLSTSGTLYTLTFKVLDTATAGDTATIRVTGATLALINDSQTQEDVTVEDASATITITSSGSSTEDPADTGDGDTDTEDGDTTGTTTPSTAGTTKSGSGSGSSKSASTDDEEEDDKELPQTGVEVVSIVAIAGLSACAIVSYVAYKKYKNI